MEKLGFYWELLSTVVQLSGVGITGFLFCRLVTPFLKKSRHGIGVGVSYFATVFVFYVIPTELDSMLVYAAGIVVATVVMYILERERGEQKLFLGAVMYLLNWMVYSIVGIPKQFAFHYLDGTVFFSVHPLRLLGGYGVVELLHLVLAFFFMAFLVHMIHRIYVRKKENISRKELGLMLATPCSALLGYGVFHLIFKIYLEDTGTYIQEVHPEYEWIQTLYQMVSYMAILAVIAFYQSIKESHWKEKENAVLLEQMENLKGHIREVELLYRDIRGLKHDMGNHVTVLENLMAKKEPQEAARYLSEWKAQLGEVDMPVKSGNPVTDVILSEKQKEAEEKGIAFRCDFHYPQETKINAFDVSIILNNALSNAIEAAGKWDKPYVTIQSYREKNAYMIEVCNRFGGQLILDRETGLPESTKDGAEHGFGLRNIRKVAQKYFGGMDMEQNGEEVRLSVMLMVE